VIIAHHYKVTCATSRELAAHFSVCIVCIESTWSIVNVVM